MTVFLIAYDLKSPGQKHSALLSEIKKYPWARLSESSYAINTNETCLDVFNKMRLFLDGNDNIYVVPLCQPYAGFGPADVNSWLDSNL